MQKNKLLVIAFGFITILNSPLSYCQALESSKVQLAGLMQLFNDEEPRSYERARREDHHRSARYREYNRGRNRVTSFYGEENTESNYRQNSYIDDENTESNVQNPDNERVIVKRIVVPQKKIRYSEILCESEEYDCIVVKRRQSWEKLFPDPDQRDLVRRLNRTNQPLIPGKKIAVPKNLDSVTLLDLAPFERTIDTQGKKLILVDLKKLAWAAYDQSGNMLHWGPVSGGRGDCPDTPEPCVTIEGVFSVFEKKDKSCLSKSFPVDRGGGAPMPFCMFFSDGFALHGAAEVPGYNASHGCVRMYKEDAEWLNHEFVELPQGDFDRGTEVIVRT